MLKIWLFLEIDLDLVNKFKIELLDLVLDSLLLRYEWFIIWNVSKKVNQQQVTKAILIFLRKRKREETVAFKPLGNGVFRMN